ncbi:SMC-Scp complex subunit ScpB [Nitrosomonas supralitoralis]|uniref:SMC-Scp complex subunit ScpB n=1 Tax=Nitrosomonas supralitoralis TaxID=2116706 RepID=A0A2P7NXS5_9PROT|nr:SMC-Scp complex subunit ScpB [Nitrosomonas supralitoralis]PSJ18259.1 SMC-Scp complex subunit ScpB [Nitrosomonas supralitoralis]
MSAPLTPLRELNTPGSLNPEKVRRILEAALLATSEPLSISELRKLFNQELSAAVLSKLLEDVRDKWRDSGVELVTVASGWRFQTKADIQPYLERLTPPKAPRYSRAVLETLAIIAYRQPVTRGDIEEIRGVSVSGSVLKTLIARGWIEAIGHRNAPGKPALFATTQHFLNDLNLRSLEELPPLEEMKSLIDSNEKIQDLPFEVPEEHN